MSSPRNGSEPESPRAESLRPTPPEVRAFDERAAAVGDDLHERVSWLVEEERASLRLQVETKNQLLDELAETRNEASAAKLASIDARKAVAELDAKTDRYELARKASAELMAEMFGQVMAELALVRRGQAEERVAREAGLRAESEARAQADSLHEQEITGTKHEIVVVQKKLTAREAATYAAGIGTGVGVIEGLIYLLKHL